MSTVARVPVVTCVTARSIKSVSRRSTVIVRAEPPTFTPTPPPVSRPVTFSVKDAFSFSAPKGTVAIGSGPELMNGRLAMMAILSAAGAELATGQTVVEQISVSPASVVLLISGVIASTLVTFCANVKPPIYTPGPLKAEVELLNGRAAMVGFAIMVASEAASGQAMF
jgi:hypothetical protein